MSAHEMLEFNRIIEMLKENALTERARERFSGLHPTLDRKELTAWIGETSEARNVLERIGSPPLMQVKKIQEIAEAAGRGEMISIEELEMIRQFASSCQRLKRFLERCESIGSGIAGYGYGMDELSLIDEEMTRCIRGERVEDEASKDLKDIRKRLSTISANIRLRLESILKSRKECFSESFVSNRNGHFTLPVKKEHKLQISGSVIDVSSTGSTYFIEPSSVAKLKSEFETLQIEESNEERKILYTLSDLVAGYESEIQRNLDYIETLDYMFAKGKLSQQMQGTEPVIRNDRTILIEEGRHPLIKRETCVPLTIRIDGETRGIVITGPNTGGKTVALKTVGLFSLMAQCGLHIPCVHGEFCMCSQVLCDIGDGQSISENLSTFSSHMKSVISILSYVNSDSLVLMDELGSGTDPAEGMGIAVSILEELKESKCMFVVTTHYPEVKEYASATDGLVNARMAFDKESLKPLYRLEVGAAGESCALYIAKQLGLPRHMLVRAYEAAYPKDNHKKEHHASDLSVLEQAGEGPDSSLGAVLREQKEAKSLPARSLAFVIGDSVVVHPEKKLGIVYQTADCNGMIGVQIQKQKKLVNYKRLQLKTSAKDLYPEDYDFSIIFDTVQNRKARKLMGKRHVPGLEIKGEE